MFIIHLIDEGSPTLPPHLLPIFVASPPQWVLGMVQEPKTRTFQDPLLNPGGREEDGTEPVGCLITGIS